MEDFQDNFTPMPWRTWAPLGESLYAHVLAADTPVTGPIKRADAVRIVKSANPLKDIPNELLDDCTITAVTPEMMQEWFDFIGAKDAKIFEAANLVADMKSELDTLREELAEARKELETLKNKKPLRPPFA